MQDHYSDRMKEFYTQSYASLPYYYNGLDGIINDQKRNQFYDEILKQCKGKRCVDAGSGSGLLAFIAIKHGADHVTCIEQNKQSCEHIETVVKNIGIEDKVRVIHDEFQTSRFHEYELGHVDIIFHELVGSYIWDETIGNSFDEYLPNIKILPSEYKLKFSTLILKEKLYKQLIDYHSGRSNYKSPYLVKFDPGIDIFDEYIEYYEKVMNSNYYDLVHPFKLIDLTHFHDAQFIDLLHQKSTHLHTNIIDINDIDKPKILEFNLPKTNQPYLILCHPYMSDGNYTLDWRESSSFSGYRKPFMVPPNFNASKFIMDLSDGYIYFDKFLNNIKKPWRLGFKICYID
jgi:SAM-dependent methyltransferase